jgi:hypothetical protein
VTVVDLFEQAGLSPIGPVQWGTEISESCAGIYVIALVKRPDSELDKPVCVDHLQERELRRWVRDEPIVYIGQTTDQTLAKRLRQFYKHIYGKKSPHRGGQAVKLLTCELWVYWSPAANSKSAEQKMIKAFEARLGRLPYANRRH